MNLLNTFKVSNCYALQQRFDYKAACRSFVSAWAPKKNSAYTKMEQLSQALADCAAVENFTETCKDNGLIP